MSTFPDLRIMCNSIHCHTLWRHVMYTCRLFRIYACMSNDPIPYIVYWGQNIIMKKYSVTSCRRDSHCIVHNNKKKLQQSSTPSTATPSGAHAIRASMIQAHVSKYLLFCERKECIQQYGKLCDCESLVHYSCTLIIVFVLCLCCVNLPVSLTIIIIISSLISSGTNECCMSARKYQRTLSSSLKSNGGFAPSKQ